MRKYLAGKSLNYYKHLPLIMLDICIQYSYDNKSEQFFGSTELGNGFQKANILYHIGLKAFSSNTPQGIKRPNKGPKELDKNIYPVVDQKRPIGKAKHNRCVPKEKLASCYRMFAFFKEITVCK